MAENVSAEQKFLNSVSKVKITDRPIFKASMKKLEEIGIGLSYHIGVNAERERIGLVSERARILPTLSDELKSIVLISDELVWDSLSNKDKQTVLNIVNDIKTLSGMDINVDSIKDNMKALLSNCMDVIGKVGEQLKTLNSVGTFSQDNLSSVLGQLDRGVIEHSDVLIPSKEDLDIVTALRMTGIDLQFNNGQWELNAEPSNTAGVSFVPTKDGKPLQVFGNENIKFLLEKYLNVTHAMRGQTVVPEKLLRVYVNEYERQLGGEDKTGLEKSVIDVEVARQRKIFSVNSDEFMITKLLDRDTIMRNAQSMALVGAFEQIVKTAKDTTEISNEINGIINSVSIDPAYSSVVKNLGKLVPMLDRAGNLFENATEFVGGYDFVAEYDRQIEYFKRTNASDDNILALTKAKEEFVQTVAVQQAFWQTKLPEISQNGKGNIFGNELASAINESMGFAVMQNEGEFVMANNSTQTVRQFLEERGIASDTYQQIVDRLQNKQASASNSNSGNSNRKVPDIFGDYCEMFGGPNVWSDIKDYANLQFYQFLWKNKFEIEFERFQQKGKGSIDAFIKQIKDTNPLFDARIVEEAYYSLYPEKAKDKPDVLNRAKAKSDTFGRHILLTDLMIKSFTPAELSRFDKMEESVKEVFLNSKFKEAEKAFALLEENPSKFKLAMELARKRHEPYIVGSTIAHMWQGAPEADAEVGKGPIVTTAVENFIIEQNNKLKKNNKSLADSNPPEPIVDIAGDNTAEDEVNKVKDGKNKKEKKTTFGDVFPSGPNTNKFLKKMKPYHPKEITKHFVEPLLEALDGIEINMKAYYQKFNSVSSSRTLSPEQKRALEEQLQQKEKFVIAVKQRDYEASAFIPGTLLFEKITNMKDVNPQLYQNADKLHQTFAVLSSTDKLEPGSKLGEVIRDKDVRDELRTLALGICGGKYKGDAQQQKIQSELVVIMDKYSVNPDYQESIKTAFTFMTPELLAYAFQPCSETKGNKLHVGSQLPIEEIIYTPSDKDRFNKLAVRYNFSDFAGKKHPLVETVASYVEEMGKGNVTEARAQAKNGVKIPQSADFKQVENTAQMKKMLNEMRQREMMGAQMYRPQESNESVMGDDGM